MDKMLIDNKATSEAELMQFKLLLLHATILQVCNQVLGSKLDELSSSS